MPDSPTPEPPALDDSGGDADFVRVANFQDRFEADLAHAKLEAEGLHCVLQGDVLPDVFALAPRQGIALMVMHSERKRALELLADTPALRQLEVPVALPASPNLSGVACPACGSEQVARVPHSEWFLLRAVLLLGLPLLFSRKTWRCEHCGTEWTA